MSTFSPVWESYGSNLNSTEDSWLDLPQDESTIHTTVYSMTARLVHRGIITTEEAIRVEKDSVNKVVTRISLIRAFGIRVLFPNPINNGITEKTFVILKFKQGSKVLKMPVKQGVKSIW